LLDGARIDYPQTQGVNRTFKAAPKVVRERAKQLGVFDPTPKWLKEDDDEPAFLKDDE
jgi:hypothetical protein